MRVRVKLFARARDLAGASEVTLELPAGATVADLRRSLASSHPQLAGLLARSVIAIADDFASDTTPISEEDEVALLPPVSGGVK